MPDFTPIQAAMMEILLDGMPHTKHELHGCCGPSSIRNVAAHVSILRKQLNREGLEIVNTLVNRRICYRLVRLLASANNGKH